MKSQMTNQMFLNSGEAFIDLDIKKENFLLKTFSTKEVHPRGMISKIFFSQLWMWLAAVPFLIWWAFRQVPLNAIWQSFRGLGLLEMCTLLLMKAALELLLSFRWRLLLKGLGHRIGLLTLAGYELAGFGVSYFTPGPQVGGEALQAYLVQRKHGVPLANSVAALTLDRLLGALAQTMLLVASVAAICILGEPAASWQLLLTALLMMALPLGYLRLLFCGKRPLTYLLAWYQNSPAIHHICLVEEQVGRFILKQTTIFWQAIFLSLVVWPTLLALDLGLALHFLGLPLTVWQILLVVVAIRVVTLMPMPAGLGTLEACLVLAMQLVGGEPALGIALSLLVRGRDVFCGAFGLLWGAMLLRS
jgi:uncharacterized membrane protein YbhN (UPF0104 family)